MKTEHKKKLSLTNTIINIAKPTAYLMLILLTYTLGYLSHSSSSSSVLPISLINTTELDSFQVKTQCGNPIPPENIRQTLINHFFNEISPFINFPPPHAAEKLHRTKNIKGWDSNAAVFERLIRKVKPQIIVEVGTFLGASTLHMVELTQRIGLKTQILCVDDFRGWAGFRDDFKNMEIVNGDVLLYYQFLQNVVSFNQTGSVLPVPFSSVSALTKLCELGIRADLVEIDAGHDFLSAWSDINWGFRILRPGGVIFGHDYFNVVDNRGVERAIDLFAKIHNFKVEIDGEHWVIYPTYVQ